MRNALDTLFDVQSQKGQFPWAGPPICHDSISDLAKSEEWPYMSDSYHLWTMLVTRHFYHLTGDLAWLKSKWSKILLGMELSTSRVGLDIFSFSYHADCASSGLKRDFTTVQES